MKEIYETLEKEFGLEKNQGKLVVESFWTEVRKYFTDPAKAKGRIIIPNLCVFHMNEYGVKKAKEKAELKDIHYPTRTVEYYEEILKTLKKNERQAGKKIDNE